MKIKCSGGDRCKKCIADDQVCVYGDRTRERYRKLAPFLSSAGDTKTFVKGSH